MVGMLDNTGHNVDVTDDVVSGRVSDEDAVEVMVNLALHLPYCLPQTRELNVWRCLRFGYGARMGGPKYYAVNLVLMLFLYHFLHTMSL
jgi:hypothetical protein